MSHQDDLAPSDILLFLFVLYRRVDAVWWLRVLPVHVVFGVLASSAFRAAARASPAPDEVEQTCVSLLLVPGLRELLESRGLQVALPHLLCVL